MGSTTLISLDEYLNTSYEPDRDFVDGVLVRRHGGTKLHGRLQLIVGSYLRQNEKSHQIQAFVETRLRVDPARGGHRVPDVLAVELPSKKGRVVTDVPAIVVEIKSPEDTFDDIVNRCLDYEKLGVANILVMDPDNKRAWLFKDRILQLLSGTSIALNRPRQNLTLDFPFAQMFAELDEE